MADTKAKSKPKESAAQPVQTPKEKARSGTCKVLHCTCPSPYQDKKYGFGMRLHNPKSGGYRCTVCSKTQ